MRRAVAAVAAASVIALVLWMLHGKSETSSWQRVLDARKANVTDPQYLKPTDDAQAPSARGATLLLFIHGAFGDTLGTWSRGGSNKSLPDLILARPEFAEGFDAFAFGYTSAMLKSGSFQIPEAATSLLTEIKFRKFLTNYARIVVVAHSMGGLVALEALRQDADVRGHVPLMVTFATPYQGAQVAVLGGQVLNNPALRDMEPQANAFLSSLRNEWRRIKGGDGPKTIVVCAYEKVTLPSIGLVVPPQSAEALCDGVADPIAEDHIGIVKPTGPEHQSIKVLTNALRTLPLAPALPRSLDTPTVEPSKPTDDRRGGSASLNREHVTVPTTSIAVTSLLKSLRSLGDVQFAVYQPSRTLNDPDTFTQIISNVRADGCTLHYSQRLEGQPLRHVAMSVPLAGLSIYGPVGLPFGHPGQQAQDIRRPVLFSGIDVLPDTTGGRVIHPVLFELRLISSASAVQIREGEGPADTDSVIRGTSSDELRTLKRTFQAAVVACDELQDRSPEKSHAASAKELPKKSAVQRSLAVTPMDGCTPAPAPDVAPGVVLQPGDVVVGGGGEIYRLDSAMKDTLITSGHYVANVRGLTVDPSGRILVSSRACNEGMIVSVDPKTGVQTPLMGGFGHPLGLALIGEDTILIGDEDPKDKVWGYLWRVNLRAREKDLLYAFPREASAAPTSIALEPKSKEILFAAKRVFRMAPDGPRALALGVSNSHAITVSRDGEMYVAEYDGGPVIKVDLRERKHLKTYAGFPTIWSLAVSLDGGNVFVGSGSGVNARVFRVPTSGEVAQEAWRARIGDGLGVFVTVVGEVRR